MSTNSYRQVKPALLHPQERMEIRDAVKKSLASKLNLGEPLVSRVLDRNPVVEGAVRAFVALNPRDLKPQDAPDATRVKGLLQQLTQQRRGGGEEGPPFPYAPDDGLGVHREFLLDRAVADIGRDEHGAPFRSLARDADGTPCPDRDPCVLAARFVVKFFAEVCYHRRKEAQGGPEASPPSLENLLDHCQPVVEALWDLRAVQISEECGGTPVYLAPY